MILSIREGRNLGKVDLIKRSFLKQRKGTLERHEDISRDTVRKIHTNEVTNTHEIRYQCRKKDERQMKTNKKTAKWMDREKTDKRRSNESVKSESNILKEEEEEEESARHDKGRNRQKSSRENLE